MVSSKRWFFLVAVRPPCRYTGAPSWQCCVAVGKSWKADLSTGSQHNASRLNEEIGYFPLLCFLVFNIGDVDI